MRLWSLHPSLLDARGLVAAWREALLAQAVLRGRTRGYRHHPQLLRFRAQPSPRAAIAAYLRGLHAEAERRGYAFAATRIGRARVTARRLSVTRRQVELEWSHLRAKLARRDRAWLASLAGGARLRVHPLFRVVPGPVEDWERAAPGHRTSPRGPRP